MSQLNLHNGAESVPKFVVSQRARLFQRTGRSETLGLKSARSCVAADPLSHLRHVASNRRTGRRKRDSVTDVS